MSRFLNIYKPLLVFSIILLSHFSAWSQLALEAVSEKTNWHSRLEEAMQVAQNQDKMILLYFSGSDWCKPCIQLKSHIFESKPFAQYATENLVLLQADFPRLKKNQPSKEQIAANEKLADQFNEEGGFPCVVLISNEGKKLGSIVGYNQESPEDYLAEIRKIMP